MDDLRVKDVMTHLVVTLRPEDKIPHAAKRLLSNCISGAPVVKGGKVVGVVSEADLVRAYMAPRHRSSPFMAPHPMTFLLVRGSAPRDVDNMTVADVMTDNVISVGPHDSIWEAASLIDRHGVRRLPVLHRDGYLIGVVTRSDLVRGMARLHEPRLALR